MDVVAPLGPVILWVAIVLVGAGRLWTRWRGLDLWTGLLTLALAGLALAIPLIRVGIGPGEVVSQESVDTAWIWCGVLAAVVAAMAASTEWLLRSLRVWAALVLVATAGALSMVGIETTSAARADRVTAIGAEISVLHRRDCQAVDQARQEWRTKVDQSVTTAEAALVRIAGAQSPADQDLWAAGIALVGAAKQWQLPADDASCVQWDTQRQSVTDAITGYDVAKGGLVVADLTVSMNSATTALDDLVTQLNAAAQTRRPAPTVQVCESLSRAGEAVGTRTQCQDPADTGSAAADTQTPQPQRSDPDVDPCTSPGAATATTAGRPAQSRHDRAHRQDRVHCQTVAVAEAAYRLAQYRDAVERVDKPSPATEQAEQQLAEAKLLAARGSDTLPTLADDIATGAHTAVAHALAVLPGRPIPDIWVLALLAGGLVFGWRAVERASNAQLAGPVEIVTFSADDAQESVAQQEHFTAALTKNVTEPSEVPGQASPTPLTDLETIVTDPTKLLASLFALAKSALNSPRGVKVDVEVLNNGSTATPWAVLVKVTDAVTRRRVATKEVTGTELADTCRRAGLWTATVALARSPRYPAWSRWSTASADALDQADSDDLEVLRKALAKAPSSGILLHKVGDALALKGSQSEALGLYARAVAADPTHYLAWYRLAATLSALEHMGNETAGVVGPERDQLTRAAKRVGLTPPTSSSEWFEELTRRTGRGTTAIRLLRRDQRDEIGGLRGALRRDNAVTNLRLAAASAVLSTPNPPSTAGAGGLAPLVSSRVRRLRTLDSPGAAVTLVEEITVPWHVVYNLACYASRDGSVDGCLSLLYSSLALPGSHALGRQNADGARLLRDPDLETARAATGFSALAAQVGLVWPEPPAGVTPTQVGAG